MSSGIRPLSGAANEFTQARLDALDNLTTQRTRAARTVAGHSVDADDCRNLLTMLGLDATAEASDARPVYVAPVM
ncbi:hypothetical protein [Actinokineospora iranica]|uniref:Uncharacterized protein n=1 Tax=Actinokineospora iranica TaxID=1271860 RepID=A0A1G6NGL1_9PSEU|nr:hypothetical protein [Actinokineospora iranica]SDC66851.1 hypothetical protein SAMN05216174_103351 [Actinokineospora iranica]